MQEFNLASSEKQDEVLSILSKGVASPVMTSDERKYLPILDGLYYRKIYSEGNDDIENHIVHASKRVALGNYIYIISDDNSSVKKHRKDSLEMNGLYRSGYGDIVEIYTYKSFVYIFTRENNYQSMVVEINPSTMSVTRVYKAPSSSYNHALGVVRNKFIFYRERTLYLTALDLDTFSPDFESSYAGGGDRIIHYGYDKKYNTVWFISSGKPYSDTYYYMTRYNINSGTIEYSYTNHVFTSTSAVIHGFTKNDKSIIVVNGGRYYMTDYGSTTQETPSQEEIDSARPPEIIGRQTVPNATMSLDYSKGMRLVSDYPKLDYKTYAIIDALTMAEIDRVNVDRQYDLLTNACKINLINNKITLISKKTIEHLEEINGNIIGYKEVK